ncbi:DUF2125 domain-containing protein [Brevundimonas sp. FT23028]|uniref:DUF2125 domain-containing protein n=1 Tax=Brevundimonas sp. FT23028 TaxID=3393748 RepID=UPI003B586D87
MSAPEQSYRHPRRGIIGPFLLVGIALAAWTGWWFYLAQQVETRLETQVAALNQGGWAVHHGEVTTSGWPFRVRVSLPRTDILAPSGHGVAAPELVAEANAWNPDHWVIIAPEGLTLTRAAKGKVEVTGDALRMSISHLRDRFPDLRLEFVRSTFVPQPGAEPFPIASAEHIQLETRPHLTDGAATTDELDVLFNLVDARGRQGGPVEGAAQNGRLTLALEGTVQQASRLKGPDAAGLFANWSRAGGRFTAVRGELTAGESRALLTSNALAVDGAGRLTGQLALTAEKPSPAISGLASAQSGAVNRAGAMGAAAATTVSGDQPVALTLQFRDGRTWLGPFALAPAPKLF